MASITSLWSKSMYPLLWGETPVLCVIYPNVNLQRVTSWCQFDMQYYSCTLTAALQAIITEHTNSIPVRERHSPVTVTCGHFTHTALRTSADTHKHTQSNQLPHFYIWNIWMSVVLVLSWRYDGVNGLPELRKIKPVNKGTSRGNGTSAKDVIYDGKTLWLKGKEKVWKLFRK